MHCQNTEKGEGENSHTRILWRLEPKTAWEDGRWQVFSCGSELGWLSLHCFSFGFSGRASGTIRVPVVCLGPCSDFKDCNGACIAKQHPKGGACMGFGTEPPTCCCNTNV
ncbi:hypothetical protein Pyn_07002 [Prunus yedoensis var. nudiflora]|uniref:Defensin-like protein n=1 Tax=Prunus yedoensis var. nudiflora TaxID=2094558 RepID=A0A314ZS27_PRUYE|nr:hypothetical protein Pyn_07002 [Prunus yedoensis var. nudiflora]